MRYMTNYQRINSVEFRKTYPRLEEPTLVMAHGHILGLYVPYNFSTIAEAKIATDETFRTDRNITEQDVQRAIDRAKALEGSTFNSRPFVPWNERGWEIRRRTAEDY